MIENKISNIAAFLDENPDNSTLLMSFGDYNFACGRRLEALQAYRKVLDLDHDAIDARLALAFIYIQHGFIQEAYEEILTALKQDPFLTESRMMYRFFAGKHPIPDAISREYESLPPFENKLRELELLVKQYDLMIDSIDYDMSRIQPSEQVEVFLIDYIKSLADTRKELLRAFKNSVSSIVDAIMNELNAEEEAKRLEEERKIAEAEAKRLEEERKIAEAEAKRLEEERKIAEEEAKRIAEEERRVREEEDRRIREKEMQTKLYGDIQDSVIELIRPLAKNKGVSAVLLINSGGYEVACVQNETIENKELDLFTQRAMETFEMHRDADTGRPSLVYWVLEFTQALIVMRLVDPSHILVAFAKTGANFGALRYSMEKVCENVLPLLKS